jgi:hypothetical protein
MVMIAGVRMDMPSDIPDRAVHSGKAQKRIGAAAIVAIVTVALAKASQEFLEQVAPDKGHAISVIIACALLSFVAAIAIALYPKKPLTFFSRSFPRSYALVGRIRLGKKLHIILCLLLTASIVYFFGSRTNIWRLGWSWWNGPKVDLSSRDQNHTFRPAVNLPWFTYGQDFGQAHGWGWAGVSTNRSRLAATFKRLRQSGVHYVLWFLLFDGRGALEFDSNGYVTGLDPAFFRDYDVAIDVAREQDMGIVWVLLDYYFMFPAKQENGASMFGHADVIEQPDKRESFLNNALKPILRRYPVESQIVGWVLVNEPENALKNGALSHESLQAFMHEASALIRQTTYRQPVSVSAGDLESLLEYAETLSSEFDFFIFHHYESFLPPPVSHIRNLLSQENDKPIYIGEFDIKKPPVITNEFVTWSQRLGYAGLWPWNPNNDQGSDRGPVLLSYEEWKIICDSINTRGRSARQLQVDFEKRHTVGFDSLNETLPQEIDWWNRHWAMTVIPEVNRNLSRWQAETHFSEDQYEENRRWESEKIRWQNILSHRKAEKEQELSLANESSVRDKKLLDAAGVDSSKRWLNNVEAELRRIETELQNQQKDLEIARQRARLTRSLADYYRYRSKWAKALYLDFWEAEKKFEARQADRASVF